MPVCHSVVRCPTTEGDRFGASLPSNAESASWKSPVDTPRSRGEPDALAAFGSPTIPDLGTRHRDSADSDLHLALGAMPVPDKARSTIGKLQIRPLGQKASTCSSTARARSWRAPDRSTSVRGSSTSSG